MPRCLTHWGIIVLGKFEQNIKFGICFKSFINCTPIAAEELLLRNFFLPKILPLPCGNFIFLLKLFYDGRNKNYKQGLGKSKD